MVNGPVAAWVFIYSTLTFVPRYLHIRPVAVILADIHTFALPPILPNYVSLLIFIFLKLFGPAWGP